MKTHPFKYPSRRGSVALAVCVPVVLSILACQPATKTDDGGENNASSASSTVGTATPVAVASAVPVSPAAKAGAGASNGFGLAIFSQVAAGSTGKNVFLSPTSLSLALSMAASGTSGDTHRAISATLGMPEDTAKTDSVNADLLKAIESADPKVTLTIANAFWYDRSLSVSPDFTARLKKNYLADATSLSFSDPQSAQSINTWAATATNNKITDLVAASDLAPPMALYLTNAVYFKGLWANPFPKEGTKSAPFHPETGADFDVPLMQSKPLRAGYLKDAMFEAVRLPYGSGAYQFYAFLPAKGVSLGDFLKTLNSDTWRTWGEKFTERGEVTVALPRFSIRYEGEMKQPLTAAGMGMAFRESNDFAPMGVKQRAAISKVKHVAVLEVNEEGTEAAAATAVGVQVVSMPVPVRLTFDHPFFCAIVHKDTGAILFAGAVYEPKPL